MYDSNQENNGKIKKTYTVYTASSKYVKVKEDIESHRDFSAHVSEPINLTEHEFVNIIVTAYFKHKSHESTLVDLLKGYDENLRSESNTLTKNEILKKYIYDNSLVVLVETVIIFLLLNLHDISIITESKIPEMIKNIILALLISITSTNEKIKDIFRKKQYVKIE